MSRISRKEFLQKVALLGVGTVGATHLLTSCGGGESEQQAAPKPPQTSAPAASGSDPCGDLSGLTEQEKAMRGTFQYVAQSPDPEKLCTNCALWLAPEGDATCGGCQIIKGPINPKGYCIQWVAKPPAS